MQVWAVLRPDWPVAPETENVLEQSNAQMPRIIFRQSKGLELTAIVSLLLQLGLEWRTVKYFMAQYISAHHTGHNRIKSDLI